MKYKWYILGALLVILVVLIYVVPRSGVETENDKELAAQMCVERTGRVPENEFTSDGCSFWPDAKIQSCCVAHDMPYWCGGDVEYRKEVDRVFGECAGEKYTLVPGWAVELGVRMGGNPKFPLPWRWGYGDSYTF